jgi:hypothetical protein
MSSRNAEIPYHIASTPGYPPQRSLSQHAHPKTASPDQGVGNLNRWSKSTTSSTGSHPQSQSQSQSHTRKRSNSFTQRMNVFIGADTTSPPRKLHKRRPSTSNSSSAQLQIPHPTFDSSSLTLPPINTLPSLQTSVTNSPSPLTGPITPSPSTAQALSALHKTVPDYFANWDEKPRDFAQKRPPSQSRSPRPDPSPSLAPPVSLNASSVKPSQRKKSRERGHSRHRSQTAKGSAGTGSSSRPSSRSSKQPSQKAMLSKALQKANTAVLLDNAQNFEGAMQAYSEACALLQQVMTRSSGDDDRRKLEAIVSHRILRKGPLLTSLSEIHIQVELPN